MSKKQQERGFSLPLLLLLLLLLIILGLIGWTVWERTKDKEATKSAPTSSETDKKPAAKDTAKPTYVMPISEAYQVALPDTWVKATCEDTPDILFLAPSADKLGRCQSESGGTVAISKNEGNTSHPEAHYTSDSYYGSVSFTPVTIDSIVGYKVSYSVAEESTLGYPPVGTQQTQYVLYDGTNTYTIVYTRFAGEPDQAATVQTLAESFDKL